MLAQLSDLLRMTLATVGVQEVPLQQELEFLRRYLDIQQTRFADRLRVIVDVPADTLDIRVPNQVLQPLVENAIHHGVDAPARRRPGRDPGPRRGRHAAARGAGRRPGAEVDAGRGAEAGRHAASA